MPCRRCQGLMVERPCWEREFHHVTRRWARPIYLWSCVNCGECVDTTILFNRAMRREETIAERNERIWRRIQKDLALHASRETLHEPKVVHV